MSIERISRRKLALWFAWPAMAGEFGPTHPFVNGRDMVLESPWPLPDNSVYNLREQFSRSIRRAIGDSEGIAVEVSGGLDSLAVLATVLKEVGVDRRVMAVTIDMTDDRGRSNVPIVQRLIDALDYDCELLTAPLSRVPDGEPEWQPEGPRLEALPDANRVTVEMAHGAGADVILTGDGADELFGSTQFLSPGILGSGRLTRLLSYWRDHPGEHHSVTKLESLALVAKFMGRRRRSMTYLACSWPDLCRRPSHGFLADDYRMLVDEWAISWIRSIVDLHERYHSSLAVMEAWSSLFPHQRLRTAGLLRKEDPFLDAEFLRQAIRLPLSRRYDPRYPHSYWRGKSQVIKLIPEGLLPFLPTGKQIFSRAILDQIGSRAFEPVTLIDAGLLRKGIDSTELDPIIAARIIEVEQWLAEALERGYELVD